MYDTENTEHPEQNKNEVYLGNTTEYNFDNHSNYKSKRLGKTAYMVDGSLIKQFDCDIPNYQYETKLYPSFVNKTEFMETQQFYKEQAEKYK